MKYKLITNSDNNIYNIKETIFKNRGINDYNTYINLNDSVLIDYSILDNIDKAVGCFVKHVENKSNIHIVVDSDCDGYTSGSIMYQYIKLTDPTINITYSIHTGKQHGLSDDIVIPENINLLIIPDAGTNDFNQCNKLIDKKIDIIILDHHLVDKDSLDEEGKIKNNAIIVNPQTCKYPNKDLCGCAVVYKFLQALDDELWNDYADKFLDLVSLALVADDMDIRSFETKRLIDKGIKLINNKLYRAIIEKQSYSIGKDFNIVSIQFYISPLINAMVRAGSMEEKNMMFKAFCEIDEFFKYIPRKSKTNPEPIEINEDIYTRVVRLCTNARSRQNKKKDEGLEKIKLLVEKNSLTENKILFIDVTGLLDKTLTGLVAMKTAEYYNRPCLMIRKTQKCYEGSARNSNYSPIENLNDFLKDTNLFKYTAGHDNAFGVGIKEENIPIATIKINELLNDFSFEHYYNIDFILDVKDLDIRFVQEMDEMKNHYGKRVEESYVLITNIQINLSNIILQGKNGDSFKFFIDETIAFVKFRADENDCIIQKLNKSAWGKKPQEKEITLNVIGKVGMNSFGNLITPQITIEEYEVIGE